MGCVRRHGATHDRERAPHLIDEIGWQTALPASSMSAYTGAETVPVTSDAAQATVYGQIIAHAACDSSIASVLFSPFVDETQLSGFQSGLERADGRSAPRRTP